LLHSAPYCVAPVNQKPKSKNLKSKIVNQKIVNQKSSIIESDKKFRKPNRPISYHLYELIEEEIKIIENA